MKPARRLVEILDYFTEADYAALVQIAKAGHHATCRGAVRSALYNYGLHFEQ